MNPQIIQEKAAEAIGKIVPVKSSNRYTKEYLNFCEWRQMNGVVDNNEEVVLAYLSDLSKKMVPSSLWAKYSMVKKMLLVNENIDISVFYKVCAFLKQISSGYEPVRSKVFTQAEIQRFLREAPITQYLLMKVVAIIGVTGACRCDEMHKMLFEHVQDTGTQLIVTIPRENEKTNKRRTFTIINEVDGVNYLEICRQYMKLRPRTAKDPSFFLSYRNQKCIDKRIGIHKFTEIVQATAKFIGYTEKEAKEFTGHCYRRTSATFLANAGADVSVLKRHGGWRSSTVAERYVQDSANEKENIARMIQGGESFVEVLQSNGKKVIKSIEGTSVQPMPLIHLQKNVSCTININYNCNK